MAVELSFIIVRYKRDVSPLVEQIHSFVKQSHEVIVSNNSEPIFLKSAEVINNKRNIGYGNACNKAISAAKGKLIFILNQDLKINPQTVDKLVWFMKKNISVNIAAPKLLNDDGSVQLSCRTFPTFCLMLARNIPVLKYLFYKSLKRHDMLEYNHATPRKVDWVSGAFMVFRKKYFFDPNFFMYFEDVDICRRTGNVWYYPDATAQHSAGHGSKKNINLFLSHLKSMLYYFVKHSF